MSEETQKSAVHIVVYGYVQGVGFRYFVQANAQRLDIVGWVRNRPDGTVEIWAEGPRESLESLIQLVHRGPRQGLVRRLETNWYSPKGEYHGFNIRW
jgi:acylphosphatase